MQQQTQVSQNLMMKTIHKIMNINQTGNPTPLDLGTFLFLEIVGFKLHEMVLENVVCATNVYALDFFCGPNAQPVSRIHRWKDHTVSKLKVFLSSLIHTWNIKINRLQDY